MSDQERRDVRKEGFRKGGMQEMRNKEMGGAGKEGDMKGDAGKEGSGKGEFNKEGTAGKEQVSKGGNYERRDL